MLDETELKQVRDYVIKILPELLRQDPEVATAIEGILAQHFPRRDEFARLLDELTALRHGTKESFEQVDQRFDNVDERFEQVDQRFDNVDERFEQVDQRFEQVDQRFEQVDQRFEQVDQRFEQVDQRFDKVDGRLDKVDVRLGKVEKTQLDIRRNVAKLQHGQEMILKHIDKQTAWLNLQTGGLGHKKGHSLEDMFAAALQFGLKNPHLSADKIRLRQKLVDAQGQVFKAGFATEIDLIAEDDHLTVFDVFEVKSTPKVSDVDFFALKVELVALQNPDKQVRGLLISPGVTEAVQQRCLEYELEVVGGPGG